MSSFTPFCALVSKKSHFTYFGTEHILLLFQCLVQGTQSFFLRALISFGTVRNPSIKTVFDHSSYLGVFYCAESPEKLTSVLLVLWCKWHETTKSKHPSNAFGIQCCIIPSKLCWLICQACVMALDLRINSTRGKHNTFILTFEATNCQLFWENEVEMMFCI